MTKLRASEQRLLSLACLAMALGGCGSSSAPPSGSDAGGGLTDAGISSVDAGARIDASLDEEVTNYPEACTERAVTIASAPNAGQWSAVRLALPRRPFTVTSVKYRLGQTDMCDSSIAHQVMVFTASLSTPPASPVSPIVMDVLPPASSPDPGGERIVEQALTTPLTVGGTDELFVAIQMQRPGLAVCVSTCGVPAGEADRNWWSGATTAPFLWNTLASFGNTGTLAVGVIGH